VTGEPLTDWLTRMLAERSDALLRWAVAWARAVPTVILVPAFGLRLLPVPLRLVMGVALAVAVIPAVSPAQGTLIWPALVLGEMARGLPLAITAATALWIATMAGGVIDNLRDPGARAAASLEGAATPLGTLLSLLAGIFFLEAGGAARVAEAVMEVPSEVGQPLRAATLGLARGIGVAVAIAAPIVVVAIVIDVVLALIYRTASSSADAITSTLRPILLLAVAAVALDRMAAALALLV
jgi:flagellar biosynthesis protein FliR